MRVLSATRAACLALVTLLATGLLLSAGCGEAATQDLDPAEQVVLDVLELRASRSTEAADYEPYFADPDIPVALADTARQEAETTISPTPEWETPELLESGEETAAVLVVWIPDDDHPGWVPATRFVLELADGSWVISDAFDVTPAELDALLGRDPSTEPTSAE